MLKLECNKCSDQFTSVIVGCVCLQDYLKALGTARTAQVKRDVIVGCVCLQGYLKALGMARTAQVKRDARMGEAEARRDAGIRVRQQNSQPSHRPRSILQRRQHNRTRSLEKLLIPSSYSNIAWRCGDVYFPCMGEIT